MAEAVLEKAVCVSCGADVREGTHFCYNCGKPILNGSTATANTVSEEIEVEDSDLKSALDLTEKSDKDEKTGKLAVAAANRKRSRVGQRKPKKVIWEEPSPTSNRIFVLVCVLIAVIAGGMVFLMVFVK